MLDIFKNIPGLRREDQETKQEEAEKKVNPFPNGPVTYKVPTNGQIRRKTVRAAKTKERKRVAGLRKQHWNLRREVAVLQARLVIVGVLPNGFGVISPDADRYDTVAEALTKQYGSIDQARQRLDDIFGVNQDR